MTSPNAPDIADRLAYYNGAVRGGWLILDAERLISLTQLDSKGQGILKIEEAGSIGRF